MKFTRRKFLRFAPASVGVFALGAVVLPKGAPAKNKVTEEMLIAAQKATDPPLIVGLSHLEGEMVNVFPSGISYTDFEKVGDQLFSRGA